MHLVSRAPYSVIRLSTILDAEGYQSDVWAVEWPGVWWLLWLPWHCSVHNINIDNADLKDSDQPILKKRGYEDT